MYFKPEIEFRPDPAGGIQVQATITKWVPTREVMRPLRSTMKISKMRIFDPTIIKGDAGGMDRIENEIKFTVQDVFREAAKKFMGSVDIEKEMEKYLGSST